MPEYRQAVTDCRQEVIDCTGLERDKEIEILPGLVFRCHSEAMNIQSNGPFRALSSAVLGGGLGDYRAIVNLKVDKNYQHHRPAEDARARAQHLGMPANSTIALMTAAHLSDGSVVINRRISTGRDGVQSDACHPPLPPLPIPDMVVIATTGFSNAAHVLDNFPSESSKSVIGETPRQSGTVNIICIINGVLTDSALAGAIITATEAKTAALQALEVHSPTGHLATGTTSDAIVIAATGNLDTLCEPVEYMGLATYTGEALAQAVFTAVVSSGRKTLSPQNHVESRRSPSNQQQHPQSVEG